MAFNVMAGRWQKLYRSTPAELSLEDAVASLGIPYRSQFPGYLFGVRAFPDFFLPTIGVVLEVDGKEHRTTEGRAADAERTEMLRNDWGVSVARCTNEEATEDPFGILVAMLTSVGAWPIPQRTLTIAQALPKPKRSPAKNRRAAASERLKAKRAALTERRRSPRGPRRKGQSARSLPAQVEGPQ